MSRTPTPLWLALAVTAVVALAMPAFALAKRAPTEAERVAIVRALPGWLRAYPVGCVAIDVDVSNNGRWASAEPVFLIPRRYAANDPCLRYASNGHFVLRKLARWKVVYAGSEGPGCKLGVPRDLERCVR